MATNEGTVVGAPIVPPTTEDIYGTHYANLGIGGFYSVANETERLAIKPLRRAVGMRVRQLDTGIDWELIGGIDNSNWSVVSYVIAPPEDPATGLVSVTSIVPDGDNEAVIVNDPVWKVDGTEYSIPGATSLYVGAATAGNFRTDLIIGKSDGTLDVVHGTQALDITPAPPTPAGVAAIGEVFIAGATLYPSINLSLYIQKAQEGENVYPAYGGTYDNFVFGVKDTFRWGNNTIGMEFISLNGFATGEAGMFDGRRITIKNENTTTYTGINHITIRHNTGTGSVKFWLPDGKDLKLLSGQHITFRYSSAASRLEYESDNSSLYVRKDLPDDFLISCMRYVTAPNVGTNYIMYITDTSRYLRLSDYVPTTSNSANGIAIIVGKHIVIQYQNASITTGSSPFCMLTLQNCSIVNNLLVWEKLDYVNFTEIVAADSGSRLHCMDTDDHYAYFATRVQSTVAPTQFIKVNIFDLHHYKVYAPFNGGNLTNIQVYKDWIYFLNVNSTATGGYIGRINTKLNTYENVVATSSLPAKRANSNTPILIVEDEIYITTTNQTNAIGDATRANTIGIQVYSIDGAFIREAMDLPIATGFSSSEPFVHWMSYIDNTIVLHTATVAVTSIRPRKLVTIQANPLQLLQSVDAPSPLLTDDNTITRDGFIYLNPEDGTSTANGWFKVHYKDLTTITNVLNFTGYYSTGSPDYQQYRKESLKPSLPSGVITKDIVSPIDAKTLWAGNEAQFSSITPSPTGVYFVQQTLPLNIATVTTAASSYNILIFSRIMNVVFNGTTGTMVLPPISGYNNVIIDIYNDSTTNGALVLNTTSAATEIWDASGTDKATVTLSTRGHIRIVASAGKWRIS